MTRVLDGYLIGRVAGGGGGAYNQFLYRPLGRIAVLDGYLIGAVSQGRSDPTGIAP
jgi:hypothetical protein